jgi:hypothetical protein
MHVGVPLNSQWPTLELIGPIAYRQLNPSDDPRWRESGARSAEEYDEWSRHLCGLACLQMVLGHRDGSTPPLFDLLHESLVFGCYTRVNGTIKGLIYRPFVEYVRARHALSAQVFTCFDRASLTGYLSSGRLALVSVHREIRNPQSPAPGRGGHLVLLTGYDRDRDLVRFNNPSGHHADSRHDVLLSYETFDRFCAQRGIAVDINASLE